MESKDYSIVQYPRNCRWTFLILFITLYRLNKIYFFSQKQKYFYVEDKLLPGNKHGFLRPEENVNLNKFQHIRCKGIGVSAVFKDTVVNGNHIEMADVVAIVLC